MWHMSLFLVFFYDILFIILREEIYIMNYLISIFTGAILAIMISLNGGVSTTSGNYASSVIIHFVGLIGIIAVLLVTKSKF